MSVDAFILAKTQPLITQERMGARKLEIFDWFWFLAYIQLLSYIFEFTYLVSYHRKLKHLYLVSYHRKLKHLFKLLVMLLVYCYPTNSKRSIS